MNETTNYKLKKPEGNEYVSIEIINKNMDTIDEELHKTEQHAAASDNPHKVTAEQAGAVPYSKIGQAAYSADLFAAYMEPTLVKWDANTLNTPYTAKLTTSTEGFAIVHGSWANGYHTVVAWNLGADIFNQWTHVVDGGTDRGWKGKLTASDVGAAESGHTHTAAEVGAAASSHKHAASEITSGALPVARGGTGLTASPSALTNLASTSAANVLQASPRPGVTGILPVANGGTGCNSLAAGFVLIGNGTGQVAGRAITDNTSNAVPSGTNLATCNTVDKGILARLNRTSSVHAANTAYTGYMARGIALVTSAPSSITNGCCAFVYE